MSLFKIFFLVFFAILTAITPVIFSNSNLGIVLAQQPPQAQNNRPVCPGSPRDSFRCHARVVTDEHGNPNVSNNVAVGYGPAQFRGAYSVSGVTSTNKTIAIVDAYNDPNILSDLNRYSDNYHIPKLASCPVSAGTTTRPCFQKVNQRGSTTYPRTDSGWSLEIALDVETAHGMCQNCNILLVEADNASYYDLMAAEDRAYLMGANAISNSWGSAEFGSQDQFDNSLNHPGVAITFSSGDSGYGAQFPASSRFVTGVGGTTLNMSGNSYVSETVWSGSGSGCSAIESKPTFQTDLGCNNRTVADVSADADPSTGAAVYDSVKYYGQTGWFKVGGTSLASPIVAGVYALGGVPAGVAANSMPYNNTQSLRDITSGSNGTCTVPYLCTGSIGYDGPTGLGTPNGPAAF